VRIITYETKKGLIQSTLLEALKKVFSKIDSEIILEVEPAKTKIYKTLFEWDGTKDLNSVVVEVLGNKFSNSRILIGANDGSKYKNWCLEQCSCAKWGCSAGIISIDYSPNNARLSNQLHECLHFFDVDDCYEIKNGNAVPKPSCTDENCVMRYGIVTNTVCDNVLHQLKTWKG